jgi:hypothetical protein
VGDELAGLAAELPFLQILPETGETDFVLRAYWGG